MLPAAGVTTLGQDVCPLEGVPLLLLVAGASEAGAVPAGAGVTGVTGFTGAADPPDPWTA